MLKQNYIVLSFLMSSAPFRYWIKRARYDHVINERQIIFVATPCSMIHIPVREKNNIKEDMINISYI